jgi:peptide/nickel transport system permease protein
MLELEPRSLDAVVGPPHRGARNWPLLIGGGLMLLLVLVAVFAPLLASNPPNVPNSSELYLPPSAGHLFGTDAFGRDVFARVLFGGRYDLGIALASVTMAAVFGALIGALLGYFGGVADTASMRIVEIVQAFPSLILALLLVATFGSGVGVVVFVVAFLNIPIYVRLVRAEFQVQRNLEYVDAARAMGVHPLRIVFRHIFPNTTPPVIAYLPVNAVFSIVIAAGLGFLGLGVQSPTPEWGVMIAAGTNDVISGFWWTSVFPGIALIVASLAFYLLGDGLERRVRR